MNLEKFEIKSYLDWSLQGRKSILLYIIGFFFVIITSLFIGQMFVVTSQILPGNSPAIRIFKLTFFGFIFSFLTIPLIIGLIHKRPWWSIAMPFKKIEFKNFCIGFGVVLAINAITAIIGYISNPSSYTYTNVNLSDWALLFFLALLCFFVQTATEEMVYRGYISQFVYRMTKNPFIAIIVSSIIFSWPHIGNIGGVEGIYAILPYFIVGSMFGWLAYRSGSLWMSTGAHMANNWFLTLFIGSNSEKIEKLTLFTKVDKISDPSYYTTSSLIYTAIVITVIEIILKMNHTKTKN